MLKRSSENAIRALVYIQLRNWEGSRPGITEIAREIEAPFAFTAKILQTLTRHLLINSIKGRGGGFFFSDDGYKLRLYDVIVVMEGNHLFKYCGFGFKKCKDENPCPLHDPFVKVREEFLSIVKIETIESLALKIKNGKAVLNRITN